MIAEQPQRHQRRAARNTIVPRRLKRQQGDRDADGRDDQGARGVGVGEPAPPNEPTAVATP